MVFARKLEVDASAFLSPQEVHYHLKKILNDEAYIGNNLDALYDVLTSIAKNTSIVIIHFDVAETKLGDYAKQLMAVFVDSASKNKHLEVTFQ